MDRPVPSPTHRRAPPLAAGPPGADENPFRAAFAEASAAMVLAGHDGRVVEANRAFARLLGRAEDGLAGLPLADLVHPDDRKAFESALLEARLGADARPSFEVGLLGGTSVRALVAVTPLRGAGDASLLVEAQDAAARQADEDGLRRLAAIVESTEDAILTVSPEGLVTNWNPGAERLFGYAASEIVGRHLRALVPPEHEADVDNLGRVLSGGVVRHYETERLRKDGARVQVSVSLSPLRGPDGAIFGVSGIVRDMSERRELETVRRQVVQSEKLTALGTLVLGVGHEIKTPLTFIAGHLYHVQRRLEDVREEAPALAEELLPPVQEALEGVDRINHLVLELRRFTRTQPGSRVSARLDGAVSGAVKLFRATHRGQVQPEEDLAPTPPLLLDVAQVQQVALNLLENGADAMPSGGVLRIATRDAGDHAELTVSDEGPGIPPEVQARMFEAFYTTKPEGSGLGLSIVRRIVEAHGGAIRCESAQGRGTTFRVRFPYRRPPLPPGA